MSLMNFIAYRSHRWYAVSATLLVSALLLTATTPAILAHSGHGNEFQGGAKATTGSIQVDAATAKRMGINVAAVRRQRLALGIKTTGQIETAPNRKVEVTTPITGTVTKLFVQPGEKVQAGQPVALLSSADIANLRVDSIQKRSEAEADLRKAEADLSLAQQNARQQRQIASADLQQARSQLEFSQEKYDRDQELLKVGAIPRRQALESQTQLMQIKSVVAKAASRLDVLRADSQLQKTKGETRVVPVKTELDNPEGLLKPGMFAELEVLTGRSSASILVIPKSALVATNEKKTLVFVQNGSAYQPVEVTLGQTSGDLVEVKSGLFDGDSVVVQRATQLYAQSLRGSSPKTEDNAKTPERKTVPDSGANFQSLAVPWWGMLGVGGAIATTTFWAGMAVAGRRKQTRKIPQQDNEVAIYKVEEHLDQPALILQSSRSSEEYPDHHQSQ
jgi:multidrug efflux pump subunit AcrA (membrane-fusion protein)